jgi:glycosyltransferase involved in cell wall biosynthesis
MAHNFPDQTLPSPSAPHSAQTVEATYDHAGSAGVTAAPDIIFTFAFTSWSGAAARGFSFPEDRLASALPGHPRVGRVLVCDPFRGAPRKLAHAALGHRDTPFPASEVAFHHAPVRMRRDDPVDLRSLERTYAAYERGIHRAAVRHGLTRPAVVTANPLLAGFGDFGWAGPVTYYAWDDWAAAEPWRRWWPMYAEAFARLREKRRRVVAVSAGIVSRLAPTGAHAVVPNGIEESEWQRLPPPPDWFAALPAPRLLYVGSLQSRIDVQQLRGLAAAFPGGSITLVGPLLDPAHFAPLRDIPNIRIHPGVPRSEIRGLIGHADVGLIPHIRSPLTEAMSPLKLYEYLAGGLPVAAVDLPAITGVSERVALVPPGADMAPAVRSALALGRGAESERLAFVAQNSWERRFNGLLDVALAGLLF